MKNKKNKKYFNLFIRKAHLWLGLALAITIAIVSFTGAVLTYDKEIKQLFNPAIYAIKDTGASQLSLEAMIGLVEDKTEANVVGVDLPAKEKGQAYAFKVKKGKERSAAALRLFF